MKEKTIKLYEYAELSPRAKERAYQNWQEYFDGYGLQVHLDNEIERLLEQHKIVPVSTADKKYDSKYAKLYYSLAHCQGDGVMFEGTFTWKGYTVNVRHSGHYYHSYSKAVEITNSNGGESPEGFYNAFEKVYQKICKELEREGYAYIGNAQSEEAFIEDCNAYEWTFREDGTMENE